MAPNRRVALVKVFIGLWVSAYWVYGMAYLSRVDTGRDGEKRTRKVLM